MGALDLLDTVMQCRTAEIRFLCMGAVKGQELIRLGRKFQRSTQRVAENQFLLSDILEPLMPCHDIQPSNTV